MAAILTLPMLRDRYWEVFCFAENELGNNNPIQISVFILVLIKHLQLPCATVDCSMKLN